MTQQTLCLPNGKEAVRDVIQHGGAVAIVAVTNEGNLLMVRQYRPGSGSMMLELPAGKLDLGEKPQKCALRELEEETGYRAYKIKPLLKVYPVAAYCTEHISLFLAEDLRPGTLNPDEDEFLEVEAHSMQELLRMIGEGEITDMKTIMGVLYYRGMEC